MANLKNTKMREEETTIDLLALAQLLIRKIGIIALVTLGAGLIAYLATLILVTPQYTASITLYVNNTVSRENSTSLTSGDLSASAKLVDTYVAIINSNSVLEKVIDSANIDISIKNLKNSLSSSSVNSTEVFRVTVTNPDAKAAARIANAIAEIAPAQIAGIVEGSSVKVVDYAKIPTETSSPSYSKNTLMGMVAGFVVICGIIVVLGLMDTSVKTAADFERWNYPVLAVIPDIAEASKAKSAYGGYGYGSYSYANARAAQRRQMKKLTQKSKEEQEAKQ